MHSWKSQNKLEFFCREYSQLCCIECINRIKSKKNGAHINCDLCPLEDIKDEKNKLDENIKYLENLSNTLEDSVNKLKNLFEKINKSKEELKLNIQKVFTKIRNI